MIAVQMSNHYGIDVGGPQSDTLERHRSRRTAIDEKLELRLPITRGKVHVEASIHAPARAKRIAASQDR
jgi:hypothetical protein